ncbi:hypothetical protein GOL29_03325 [Sinorhizobium medicae]|nr:hypothetical protein [Sinorhizobium medicae]
MTDHREIWLNCKCSEGHGREWCQDPVFARCEECGAEPVKYIRADLACLLDKPEAVEGERLESARAEQWRLRREAEAGRDTAKAVAHSFRNERDALRAALSDIIEGWDFWEVNHHDREPPRDAIRRARAALSTPADTDAAQGAADKALRKIISDAASALPNGAFIHPEASVGFMEGLPKEIELVCSNLQSEIDCLRRELEEARKAMEPFADIADFMDSETSGFSQDDTLSLDFKADGEEVTFVVQEFPLRKFYAARAALRAGEEGK